DVPEALLAAGASFGPQTVVCVDNSLAGHGLRWPVWSRIFPRAEVVVVESVTKYLSSRCSAGVVYGAAGPDGRAERVRQYARAIGVNLQERAFNHLVHGELEHCALRVALHAGNAERFAGAMDTSRWQSVQIAHARTPLTPAPGEPGADGRTGVLFCVPPQALAESDAFPQVPGLWRGIARQEGVALDVRAGFGWSRTACRTYGADPLNQLDGRPFLRIAVGLETAAEIDVLATTLGEAVARAEKGETA
ncbi:hypothetical protein ACWDZ8_43120, partial [Streptomyces sp. NPDC003233]